VVVKLLDEKRKTEVVTGLSSTRSRCDRYGVSNARWSSRNRVSSSPASPAAANLSTCATTMNCCCQSNEQHDGNSRFKAVAFLGLHSNKQEK